MSLKKKGIIKKYNFKYIFITKKIPQVSPAFSGKWSQVPFFFHSICWRNRFLDIVGQKKFIFKIKLQNGIV
jgi:hypothetical protein